MSVTPPTNITNKEFDAADYESPYPADPKDNSRKLGLGLGIGLGLFLILLIIVVVILFGILFNRRRAAEKREAARKAAAPRNGVTPGPANTIGARPAVQMRNRESEVSGTSNEVINPFKTPTVYLTDDARPSFPGESARNFNPDSRNNFQGKEDTQVWNPASASNSGGIYNGSASIPRPLLTRGSDSGTVSTNIYSTNGSEHASRTYGGSIDQQSSTYGDYVNRESVNNHNGDTFQGSSPGQFFYGQSIGRPVYSRGDSKGSEGSPSDQGTEMKHMYSEAIPVRMRSPSDESTTRDQVKSSLYMTEFSYMNMDEL